MTEKLIRFGAVFTSDTPPSVPRAYLIKTNDGFPHARTEACFYRDIATLLDNPPIPPTFDIGYDEQNEKFYVLQADLSETHVTALNQTREPTIENLAPIVDEIARVHAACWDRDVIEDDIYLTPRRDICDMAQAGREEDLQASSERILQDRLPRIFKIAPDDLPGSWLDICRTAISSWPDAFVRRCEAGNLTLIHADLHPWNVLVPHSETGPPIILDWELLCRGLGIFDITYLILRCRLEAAERRTMEEKLIARYHNRICELGVEGYDLETCRQDYRLSIVANILPPLAWGRPRNLQSTMEAFFDWDCEEPGN